MDGRGKKVVIGKRAAQEVSTRSGCLINTT
jgi:hypothetical protein